MLVVNGSGECLEMLVVMVMVMVMVMVGNGGE